MNRKAAPFFMILGMVLAWTLFYTMSKLAVDLSGSALLTGALIRAAALLFLTAELIITKKMRLLFRQGKTTWILLFIGVFGFLLDLFANLGYRGGSLSTGTALLKTDVLMVSLVSVFVYKKKMTWFDWLATALMLAGVLLVLGIDFQAIEFHCTDLFFLLSAASVSANAFIIKHIQEKNDTDSEVISYYNNFVVFALFSASAGIQGDVKILSGPVPPLFGLIVLIGGLAQTGIYFFYYRNLKRFEVWQVKLYLLTMPVFSAMIGVLFLNETLSVFQIIGIFVVLFGAALIIIGGRLRKETKTRESSA